METLIKEVEINAHKDKVWAILAEIGSIQICNHSVSTSFSTSDEKQD